MTPSAIIINRTVTVERRVEAKDAQGGTIVSYPKVGGVHPTFKARVYRVGGKELLAMGLPMSTHRTRVFFVVDAALVKDDRIVYSEGLVSRFVKVETYKPMGGTDRMFVAEGNDFQVEAVPVTA